MQIGVMLNNLERDRLLAWQVAIEDGVSLVHTNALAENWLDGRERQQYIDAATESGITIHTMFIGFDGQDYSDIATISRTVGLLPIPHLRQHRLAIARKYSDLAEELHVPHLALHLGFMPQATSHPDYRFLVEAVQQLAEYCQEREQTLHLETGQEAAEELLTFLHEVDRPNLGINFDCGNFLLYGIDDPLDALDVLGPYVRAVHCKDGFRPTAPGQLGQETPLGLGDVDFPRLFAKLRNWQFQGPLIIEREGGSQARDEIREAVQFLEKLVGLERRVAPE